MRTFIIDANALLSFVTDRNPEQQGTMKALFQQASSLDCRILCHTHVITEFVYVLDKVYGQDKRSIRQMIMDLIALPGIDVAQHIDFKMLLDYWPDKISDFGDSVVACLWFTSPHAQVVTFDKRFIKELKCIGARVYPL
jgi:predicted nucleic-acid-binding protein